MKRIVVTLALLASIHHAHSVTPEPSCPQKKELVEEFIQTRSRSFDEAVCDAHIVVVDFYGLDCPPCKKLSPLIQELANELPDVKFMKVEVSKNNALARKYSIRNIPQILFFKGGDFQKGATLRGNQTKDTIKRAINKLS